MKTLIGGFCLIIISLLAFPFNGLAQKSHILEFGSGLFQQANLNELISPLRYEGYTIPLSLNYQAIRPKDKITIGGYGSYQKLNSSISKKSEHLQKALQLELYFGYHRKINRISNKKFTLYAGIIQDVLFSYRKQIYNPGDEENYIDVSVSLISAGLGYNYNITSGSFISQNINFTLLGLDFRTPYYGLKNFPNIYVEFPDHNVKLIHRFSYCYQIGRHLRLDFIYRILYHYYDKPFKSHTLTNNFLFGLGVNL